ncbi:MAG TPA: UDP-N-acetylglucosamine 2-epimerase (non-hydrolyzing) [Candidatus Udaeobacter sp.]|jgi:UDP-N-acetylglucosamine 2-epimerase (non-hydrolysing)|nr:UDP-N-acetylglucosamine 2-epimerase (non-hydrolyzing) [Candidatus Udaeobacter sp.]
MRPLTLLIVAGARPNFMKVAPLIKALKAHNLRGDGTPIEFQLLHTGQHYDAKMSDIFFGELGIPAPDINLEVGSGTHAAQTANVMKEFEPVCASLRPDWVIVVGDINSTLACTLVAAKLEVRVAHVEAGLRSFDRTMPEEINRVVTDALADLLFTPSSDADDNLRREGISALKIKFVGNIMIDTLVENLAKARKHNTRELLGLHSDTFAYVTLHRPSNVDQKDSLCEIMTELRRLSDNMQVVFPIHPRTRKMLLEFGIPATGGNGLKIVDPIGYYDSLHLTEQARFVLTDSGGLQEESTFFRTPCLTLRPNTERPITVSVGSNRLTSLASLRSDIEGVLNSADRAGSVPPLWDGHTSDRVIRELATAPITR